MEYDNKILHNNISVWCNNEGITLYQLEKRLNMSRNSITRCDQSTLSWIKVAQIADYFHISLDELTGRSDTQNMSQAALILSNAAQTMYLTNKQALLGVDILTCIKKADDD